MAGNSVFSQPPLPPLQAFYYYHPYLLYTDLDTTYSCIDLNTISYILALALSGKEVLRILQSRGQATCLIVDSRKKTTYKSAPFSIGGDRARDVLQKKVIKGVTSKVMRETAGWTRSNLTLGMSTSASTKPFLYGGDLSSLCDGDGRKFRHNSR